MRKTKEIRIPKIDENLAYFCGVLMGDGYIKKKSYNKWRYVINCGGNILDEVEYYNQIIAPLAEGLFGLPVKARLLGKTYGINIMSKNLVNFLIDEIGMTESPKENLQIPPIFRVDENLTCSFIAGLADTDFSYQLRKGTYPIIKGSSKSKSLMTQVSNFLELNSFSVIESFNYQIYDERLKKGYNIINRIDINGHKQFVKWINLIGTRHPKNLKRIEKWKQVNNSKPGVKNLIEQVK